MQTMARRIVEFSGWGYKIRKVFAKESTYSKKIIDLTFFDNVNFWHLPINPILKIQ